LNEALSYFKEKMITIVIIMNSGQQSVIIKFFKSHIVTFSKGQVWSGVTLHRQFVEWITCNPSNRMSKFCVMFPKSDAGNRKTKVFLKMFLDDVLKLKKNCNTKKYWVKNKLEADRLNLCLQSLK